MGESHTKAELLRKAKGMLVKLNYPGGESIGRVIEVQQSTTGAIVELGEQNGNFFVDLGSCYVIRILDEGKK